MTDAFRASAPPPGPPRPYSFPRVTRQTLSNGLSILVAENQNLLFAFGNAQLIAFDAGEGLEG